MTRTPARRLTGRTPSILTSDKLHLSLVEIGAYAPERLCAEPSTFVDNWLRHPPPPGRVSSIGIREDTQVAVAAEDRAGLGRQVA